MKELNKETVSRRELCQFGIGLSLLFCLVGGALLWHGYLFGSVVLLPAVVLAVAFWRDWPGVRLLYVGWMKVAMVMARIMTTLLLTLMYLLVLTPIALLGRVCGQQFLERGFREKGGSYWIQRVKPWSRNSCEKQS